MKIIIVVLWLSIYLYISSFLLDMMSTKNTIENFIGFIILLIITIISWYSKLGIKQYNKLYLKIYGDEQNAPVSI